MYKCIYHSKDNDGFCSAAIVKQNYPKCKLIGLNHGDDEFPWHEITEKDTVIMVDYSLKPFEEMLKLQNKCKKFIWIDHHETAIQQMEESDEKIKFCSLSDIQAACVLTWKYFYPDEDNVPCGVELLSQYDLWDHRDPEVVPYEMGIRTLIDGPNDEEWWKVLDDDYERLEETIQLGKHIIKYQDGMDRWNMRFSFPITLEGVRFICINNVHTGSLQFNPVWDKNKYDATLVFFMTPKRKWKIRMYTEKKNIDLAPIAVKYGGGGHRNACGCTVDKLPF